MTCSCCLAWETWVSGMGIQCVACFRYACSRDAEIPQSQTHIHPYWQDALSYLQQHFQSTRKTSNCCCSEWYHREMLFQRGLKYPGKEIQIGDLVMAGVREPPQYLSSEDAGHLSLLHRNEALLMIPVYPPPCTMTKELGMLRPWRCSTRDVESLLAEESL